MSKYLTLAGFFGLIIGACGTLLIGRARRKKEEGGDGAAA